MKSIERAEKHRLLMEASLKPINKKLSTLLEDDNACVFYQSGDGWCILFGDALNAPAWRIDFAALLAMSKQDALEYLENISI